MDTAAASAGMLWWVSLAALGLVVGLIAGMFGVGGGFLLTPLLAVLFQVPLEIAVGTGMCQMIGVAVAAQIRYARLGEGESKLSLMMSLPALLGVGLGARAVAALSAVGAVTVAGRSIDAAKLFLSLGFIAMLAGVAAWMMRDARRAAAAGETSESIRPGALTRLRFGPSAHLPRAGYTVSIFFVSYIGLGIGFISGLLGVGGGVILTPVLLYNIGMSVRASAATGVGLLLATSLVGTFAHARLGNVDLSIAMTLLIGSTLGAQAGAVLAARIDGRRLRGFFAYLVLLTAAAVALDLARKLLAS